MAHFAELDEHNIVLRVIVVSDDDAGPAPGLDGEAFCAALCGGRWKQTSYNTRGNVHYNPVTGRPSGRPPFRGHYAGIGYTYNPQRDVFIPPQPYPSWTLNNATVQWEAPVPHPQDGTAYVWDEPTQNWAPA